MRGLLEFRLGFGHGPKEILAGVWRQSEVRVLKSLEEPTVDI